MFPSLVDTIALRFRRSWTVVSTGTERHGRIGHKLEIHACNNPSPVLKRCILSAVASTSSQGGGGGGGGVRLDIGGGGWWLPKCFQMYKNISGHIIIFPKIQLFSNSLSHVLRIT